MKQSLKLAKTAVVTTALRGFDREIADRYLIKTLSEMTGLGAKLGQILGMRLNTGDSIVPLMAKETIESIIEQQARYYKSQLAELYVPGIAASIGQAHKAQLADGRIVCIKVRRPQIAALIDEQLSTILLSLKIGPPKKFGIDVEAYSSFLRALIASELDYRSEGKNQVKIAKNLLFARDLIIPKVLFTSEQVLIQSYEAASNLKNAANWPSIEARSHAGQTLSDVFFHMLLVDGLLHADLHPANLGFRLSAPSKLVIYDYGCVVSIDQSARNGLKKLLSGETIGRKNESLATLIDLGFDADKVSKIRDLNTRIERFVEDILHFDASTTDQISFGRHFRDDLGSDSWWFRTAGPPWFLFVIRSFFGVIHALNQLGGSISFRQSINNCVNVNLRQETSVNRERQSCDSSTLIGRYLKVSIKDKGADIISLEFPSRAVEDLEDLLPEQTLAKLTTAGYDIASIKNAALQRRCPPSILFEDKIESRFYKIWIE